ncbi:Anaphase-promoting complex subunit 2 [Coemansia sp. RSA 2703]|nr:Anaphase-promoting complex subunit 2 [Coemansia sp. RSA 2703]KAJ2378337.1 Anaphase-promoting complex subunit 2 [Coemansia sp. RSA 2607]KAJ2398241.1 Anaphase-promoting complex subunit 2 [Coemansia sp. RSA 2603]
MTQSAVVYDMLGDRTADDLQHLAQRILSSTPPTDTQAQRLRAHLRTQRRALAATVRSNDLSAYTQTADFLQELSSSRTKLTEHMGDAAGSSVWRALAHEQMADTQLLAEWVAVSLDAVVHTSKNLLLNDSWAAEQLAAHKRLTGCVLDLSDAEPLASTQQSSGLVSAFVRGMHALCEMQSAAWVPQGVSQGVALACTQAAGALRGTWDCPVLAALVQRMQTAGSVLDALLGSGDCTWQNTCVQAARRSFAQVRREELFALVVEYPASHRPLDDLRTCCARQPGMLRAMAQALQHDVCSRLLHAGAATGDIVAFYAAAVGALGRVDRTGLVLWSVANPIRRYLQGRPDAITCIVGELLDGALADDPELLAEPSQEHADVWYPRPRDAQGAGSAAADVAVQLLGVFDADAYVRAFDAMLAARLLKLSSYDASAELRQVERMAGYLGARAVERSRVMLRDIAESRRLDSQVAGAAMHATVVSRQFWPAAAREPSWTPPSSMAQMAEQWAGAYEALRPARRLEWRHAQGSVALEVQMLDGREVHVRVRPIDAAVLMAIEGRGRTDAKSIAESLECQDVTWVRSRLRAWVARGVLREPAAGVFESADHTVAEDTAPAAVETEDIEEPEEPESSVDPSVPDLSVHYNYIVGMLTNIGPLPLDRIHAMLAMFVPGDATTAEQLRAFLARKLRDDDERLELSGGMYRLRG